MKYLKNFKSIFEDFEPVLTEGETGKWEKVPWMGKSEENMEMKKKMAELQKMTANAASNLRLSSAVVAALRPEEDAEASAILEAATQVSEKEALIKKVIATAALGQTLAGMPRPKSFTHTLRTLDATFRKAKFIPEEHLPSYLRSLYMATRVEKSKTPADDENGSAEPCHDAATESTADMSTDAPSTETTTSTGPTKRTAMRKVAQGMRKKAKVST